MLNINDSTIKAALHDQGFKFKNGRHECPVCGGSGLSVTERDSKELTNCFSNACSHEAVKKSLGLWQESKDYKETHNASWVAPTQPKQKSSSNTKNIEWELAIAQQKKDWLSEVAGSMVYNSHEKLRWYLNSRGIHKTQPTIDMGYISDYCTGHSVIEALVFLIKNISGKNIGAEIFYMNDHGLAAEKRRIDGYGLIGGFIPITKGDDHRLFLCEGIITAYSVAELLLPGISTVWALCGTSGFKNITIPDESFSEIVICADNDQPGIKAASELYTRLIKEGKNARILMPDPIAGHSKTDWNDTLMGVCQ